MEGIQTINALKAVQSALSSLQPTGVQTVMLFAADGTPIGKYEAHKLIIDHAYQGCAFGTCGTSAGTAAKTATISNFLLLKNCRVSIRFDNGMTATSPTLNINSTGAKAIRLGSAALTPGMVNAGAIVTMVYDGSYWQVTAIQKVTAPPTPGAVDLGLPSGTLWAEKNIGANKPTDFGLYFSWGNVEGHAEGSGYDFGSSNDGPYASTPGAALTGNIPTGNTYDAARKNMGAPWRMPTTSEFVELNSNCSSEWLTQDGVAGRRFTSNINGNSIFFPACGYYRGTALYSRGESGYYWSSSLQSSAYGYLLYFSSSGVNPQGYYDRFNGFSVRGVQ